MTAPRRLRLWFRALLRPSAVERELTDELRHHIELETEKNIRTGMDPVRARRKAKIDFGGEERFKEQTREARSSRLLEDVLLDVRYGSRQLRKNPGFTTVALLSLTLGIGANTAIFSVVNAVLLRPLPYSHPERIVVVEEHAGGERQPTFSPRDYLDLKEQSQTLEVVAGLRRGSMSFVDENGPDRVRTQSVTPNFFRVFGVEPHLGRFFSDTPEEDTEGKLVVLSYGAWQTRFGGDASVLGTRIRLDGESHTVVGVAPSSFRYPEDTEMWVRSYRDGVPEPPVDVGEDLAEIRSLGYFSVLGRLGEDATLPEAQAEMTVLADRIHEFKDPAQSYAIGLVPLQMSMVADVRLALLVLFGAVGLVLLIACTNVANLLLARSASRTRELAVRASLGATRRRLFRQLLVESLLLGGLAGVLGLALARWGFGALLEALPAEVPRLTAISIDGRVLVFTVGAALITGLLFGMLPALDASRADLGSAVREGARGIAGGRRQRRTRELLVVGEVALAVILLAGAGLLVKSLVRLQDEALGFDPEGVLVMRLSLPSSRYPDEPSRKILVKDLLQEVEALPGVRSAGVALAAPFAGGAATMSYVVEGIEPAEGDDFSSEYQVVTEDYFRTMGIPVLEGRGLQATDGEGEGYPEVAVVNEAFARRHWGDENPIGQRISFNEEVFADIVGVVGDVRHFSFDRAPRPEVYMPYYRDAWPILALVVKAQGDPRSLLAPVRGALGKVDPEQPASTLKTMTQILGESTGDRRFTVELLGLFTALALLLAVVGVYGVMAYTVGLRRPEMGIRVALGASPDGLLWMSIRSGLRLAVLGMVLGLAGTLGLTRLLGSLLYSVSPTDPLVLSCTALAVLVVVSAAAYLPARRAAGLDPATVLRSE